MKARSLALIACLLAVPSLGAYVQLTGIKWNQQPVPYRVTNRDVSGVTASQLQGAISRSFDEWGRPENVALTSQFVGFTSIEPHTNDGLAVIGFRSRPDLDRTLGSARFEFNSVTGQFVAADIFLNSIFSWSVAPNGEPGRFDTESILVHEIGHLLGLGHSALGETSLRSDGGRTVLGKRAVMFPIAFGTGSIADRTIEPDDVAGITDIYGTSAARQQLGQIAGRVTLNGSGVFGAHITAANLSTGEMVSGYSLNASGDFVIDGLKPGVYIVRAEPLDDVDTDSIFDEDTPVNLNFRVTYHSRHVAVPAGGTSGSIEIKVRAK